MLIDHRSTYLETLPLKWVPKVFQTNPAVQRTSFELPKLREHHHTPPHHIAKHQPPTTAPPLSFAAIVPTTFGPAPRPRLSTAALPRSLRSEARRRLRELLLEAAPRPARAGTFGSVRCARGRPPSSAADAFWGEIGFGLDNYEKTRRVQERIIAYTGPGFLFLRMGSV